MHNGPFPHGPLLPFTRSGAASGASRGLSRRRFIRQLGLGTAAVGAGLHLASTPTSALPAPPPRPRGRGRAQRVLVLGAGLAGLAAAWELEEAGHDVTVLEARMRPGGRVWTLREPFADGLYAEAGGVAYSETYTEAVRYMEALGLERAAWAFPELSPLYHLGGRRFSVPPETEGDWPYELTAEERKLGPWGIVTKYVIETLPPEARDPSKWNSPAVAKLDEMTLGEYMRSQGASPGAIELVRHTQWFGYGTGHASALASLYSDFGLFMGAMPFVIAGGNDLLPRRMADRLSRAVEYGVQVEEIHEEAGGVEARGIRANRPVRFSGDRVISTLPATVLQGVRIRPGLPDDQARAIAEMPYMDGTRTFIQVRRGFWYDEGVTGAAATDLPIGMVNRYPIPEVGGADQRSILDLYVVGEAATRLASHTESEIIESSIRHLEKVHPTIREHFEGAKVVAWGADPYSFGHVSYPGPGDVTRYLALLQRPHGRIHFAGEHTSILRSTMEGALRSGVRAAREVDTAA